MVWSESSEGWMDKAFLWMGHHYEEPKGRRRISNSPEQMDFLGGLLLRNCHQVPARLLGGVHRGIGLFYQLVPYLFYAVAQSSGVYRDYADGARYMPL